MKVRITIEYDNDMDASRSLAQEAKDWLDGNVGLADIVGIDGFVRFESEGKTITLSGE